MLIRGAVALLLFASLAGCGRPPPPPPGTGLPKPVGATGYIIAPGATAPDLGFAGYIITASTNSYRVTWTGQTEFRGSIFTDNGAFGSFAAGCTDGSCVLAGNEDEVVQSGPDRIDFISYPLSGKRSGFDVTVMDGNLLADLLVDGAPNPQLVQFVSGDPQTENQLVFPQTIPFELLGAQ